MINNIGQSLRTCLNYVRLKARRSYDTYSELPWILFMAQPLPFCGFALYRFAGFSIYFSACRNTLNNPHH